MRAEEIIGMMNKTVPLSEESLPELRQVLQDYPYFQAAHLLYTLNLKKEKDTRLPAELKKTACYLSDRRRLFFLLEEDSFPALSIASLENEQEVTVESPFDRIDLFLSEKKVDLPTQPSVSESQADIIRTDYVSYWLSHPDDEVLETIPMKYQETIDRFLEEDKKTPIRIELKDGEESTPPVIPNLDSFDEDSFFSETLAKIYLKQKKYDRALEIIRQLYLRNPEKNRYFADQIRFLEKLIINSQ